MTGQDHYRLKSIKQIKKLLSINNLILAKTAYFSDQATTEQGIIKVADKSFRPAMHANRIYEVIKLPDKLYYSHSKHASLYGAESMPWDTDLELQIGDLIWHDYMNTLDCPVIKVDDEPEAEYKLLWYKDIYFALRGDMVIPVNGYLLCEEVENENASTLEIYKDDLIDKKVGRVRYIGTPNREYLGWWKKGGYVTSKYVDDGVDISEEDMIIKRVPEDHRLVEETMHANFDQDKNYFVIQRRNIYAKTTDGSYPRA